MYPKLLPSGLPSLIVVDDVVAVAVEVEVVEVVVIELVGG